MVTCLTDVEHCIEIGSLPRGGKHSPYSTLECGNLPGHRVIGGVLETGIEIPLLLEVEEQCHLVTVLIFECCTLHYRQFNRFTVFRLIARMKAKRAGFKIFCHCCSIISLFSEFGCKGMKYFAKNYLFVAKNVH